MKSFWIFKEENSNRALTRDEGEKWPDDINGRPSNKWTLVCDFIALAEANAALLILKSQRDEIGKENEKIKAEIQMISIRNEAHLREASGFKNENESLRDRISCFIRNFERDTNCDCCNSNSANLEEDLKNIGLHK